MITEGAKERAGMPVPKHLVPLRLCLARVETRNSIILLLSTLFMLYLLSGLFRQPYPRGICIFDFENILVNATDLSPFPYAVEAQKRCVSFGSDIAIFRSTAASAANSHYNPHIIRAWVKDTFGEVWNDRLLDSNAFQVSKEKGEAALSAIINYYERDPACTIYITHSFTQEKYTENLGASFYIIDSSLESGITESHLNVALKKMKLSCWGPKRERPNCGDQPPDDVFTCYRQKQWGKCTEAWMSNFCCSTCHNCDGTGYCTKVSNSSALDFIAGEQP